MAKLLFLAANPLETARVRLDEECRDIEDGLAAIPDRPIAFKSKWSVRPQDLQRALLAESPDLVHFSAHGDEYGRMLLENTNGSSEPVEFSALTDLFRVFRRGIRCVVLSYCDSDDQARELSAVVDCVIGMKGTVSFGAALAFATSFYQAIAFGKDVATAFELGRVQIGLQSFDEENTPQLHFRDGVVSLTIGPREEEPRSGYVDGDAREQIKLITAALGLGELAFRATPVELSPPPIVEKCSLRVTTLGEIEGRLAGRSWYAIHGGVGTGKTHLAALLVRGWGRIAWLRLRDLGVAQSANTLDRALSSIKERKSQQPRLDWVQDCCAALGPNSVIVLDDLPRTSGHDEFDDTLIFLARSLQATGVKLVTLSHYPLPPAVAAAAEAEIIEEAVPLFSDAEIVDLLAAHGAPPPFLTSAWARSVSVACRQHPVLLTAAARFLELKSWQIDNKAFMDVMTGEYAINLDAPTQTDLLRTVPEIPTRDLLYRLRCIGGSFTLIDARELASVPETIDHSSERLRSLLGLWVQKDGADRYVVSPLITRLRDANLAKPTEEKVHEVLARRLIGKGPLTALDACRAISHFVVAGLHQQAGALLLSALYSLSKAKAPKDGALLSTLWTHTRLPKEMPRSIRIAIRGIQISIHESAQKDVSFLLEDLEQLIDSDPEEGDAADFDAVVGAIAGIAFWARKPLAAIRAIVGSLATLRRTDGKIFGTGPQTLRKHYLELLWSPFSKIKRDEDLRDGLALLTELSAPEIVTWMGCRAADLGAEVMCNSLWLAEHAKNETDQDWQRCLSALGAIREWAQKRSASVLFAWAQCGTIIVLAEYLKRFDDAVQVGLESIEACAGVPKAIFWLRETLGRQYYYAGQWENALNTLLPAVNGQAEVLPYKRAYATVLAGVNAAHIATTESVELMSRAANLADGQKDDASSLLVAVVETELAFELWKSGSRVSAFQRLSQAADRLLNPMRPGDDWKIVITLFGNFAGYFTHLARPSGKHVWTSATPEPGCMLDRNAAVLDFFDPAKMNVIPAQLTLLAEGLGLHHEALKWAQRANLAAFHAGMDHAIAPYRVATHLRGGKWIEALDECWALYPRRVQEFVDGQMPETLAFYLAKSTATLVCFALGQARIEKGEVEADRIATALESHLKRLDLTSEDPFWSEFAAAARQIASGSENWKLLYETGLGWEARDDLGLGMIYRIAAVVRAQPAEAFHLTTHSFARPLVAWISDTPYATVVLPFLVSYWKWSCQSFAFRYSAPVRTAKVLESVLSSDDYLGFVHGLSVVAHSLHVALDDSEIELLRMVRSH